MNTPRGLPLLAAVVIFLAAFTRNQAQTTPEPPPATPWALADVEIPDSPLVTKGQLPNGLRYVIRPHAAPDRQLSLRLFVRAGSLDENDDERGFAHFVEHMAFNGTKNFPAGELVRFLQRQGAQFGPHINATTTYLSTVYKLDLPGDAPDSLETGLRIFRDYADGILFENSEVKRERGVILSEARTRNTPEREETLAFMRFLYGSTPIPSREPIGVAEQIEHADRSALRQFYDAWYRPENLAVIVVGTVSAPEVETLLQKHFASLQARAPARTRQPLKKLPELTTPLVTVHPRPLVGASINLTSITERPAVRPTWASRLDSLRVQAAVAMLEDRLRKISRTPGAVINAPSSQMEADFLRFRRVSLTTNCAPDNLPAAMAVLEQELRRTVDFGFTDAELARYQDLMRRHLKSSAESVSTTPAGVIADAFVGYVEDDFPLRLLDETVDTMLDIVGRLKPQDCQNALQEIFRQPPRVFVSCLASHAPSSEKILQSYQASRATDVARDIHASTEAAFGYQDFGPASTIAEKIHLDDLGLWQLRLSNGVRVNLKPTKFEAGNNRFSLRLGYGRMAEPADKPGLALWFPFLWEGGTGKHSAAELSRMIGGLNGVTTSTSDDTFVLKGTFPRDNFPKALRQITALLSDPAFREEGWEAARRSLRGYTGPLWNQPEGAVVQFIYPLLAGGDSRIGIPGDSKYLARTSQEFRDWFTPQLASGPMEFSLIGDFDIETAIDEIARTLGTLPARADRDAHPFPVELKFHQDRRVARYFYMGTADRACRWEFFWRIKEPVTPKERQQIELLASIFEDRVREEVRERKSSTYRVEGGVSWNDTYPGFSFIRCSVDHKPDDREKHTRAVRKLALTIAEKGITADELARAKSQALAALTRNQSDNGYWLEHVVADSQQRPFRLDAERSAESNLRTTTVADINTLASRYFGPDRVFHYLIEPSALKPEKK
ncbi:MAG: insulinase family protein [Nibricoccus sp.]